MAWKNWLVHHIADRALKHAIDLHATGWLLDVGCGLKPYTRFTTGLARHVGVDHPQSQHGSSRVDVASSALHLPFKNQSCDTVLCTAVLEHIEEPFIALSEASRVLKPGGKAIYLVPFIWHIHEEPRDFFRYSRYGLEYLFGKAGFTIRELRALSGFWVTFGQLFVYQLYRFHRGPLRLLPVIPILGMLVQLVALGLDRIDRSEKWTWAYLVVGEKSIRPD